MEKLIISNFLTLKHIELDINKFNIIIGSQAQGKSIIAKLVLFFQDFFYHYRECLLRKTRKPEFDQDMINAFKEIFPKYSWNDQEFEIIYNFEQYQISVRNQKLSNGKWQIKLKYSEQLTKIRNKFLNYYNKEEQIDNLIPVINYIMKSIKEGKLDYLLSQKYFNYKEDNEILTPVFIPAGRSFFASILLENIFYLISEDISIDYFLRNFGKEYEMATKIYKTKNKNMELLHGKNYLAINKIINQIIVGNFSIEKDKQWIYSKRGKISLSDASSGQQEALPMLLILTIFPFEYINDFYFFIEEPEAHLFPTSQKHIIELISLIFNSTEKRHSFFITTHSPYILTAFNNLIQAGNTLKAIKKRPNNETQLKKLFDIIPEDQILDINDFGVYTLENGELKSIINQENQLIDTNIIDEVSNQFSETFSDLLDLEFEEEIE